MKIISKLLVLFLVALLSIGIIMPNQDVYGEEYARAYLSDMTPYSKSIGYGSLKVNTNMNGDKISYIVGGKRTYFEKGYTAHATSTLVFDLGSGHPYDYFDCYMGVDASQGGKGDVKFSLYTSLNNKDWTTVISPTQKNSSSEAIKVHIEVSSIRYLKFYFDSNGGNGNDHSGIGNPLVYKANSLHEPDELIKPVEYYDEIFKTLSISEIINNHKIDALKRMLMENANYDDVKEVFLTGEKESERRQMLSWLYSDSQALEDFVMGGNPDGTYLNALSVLSDLYKNFKDDLEDDTALYSPEVNSSRTRGDVYRVMMMAIALTHAGNGPHMWLDGACTSDPIERYEAFKKTYTEGLLRNDVFENLNTEEMRYVMGARMHNDEIYWLNNYVRDTTPSGTFPGIYSPHRYLKYGKDWDYTAKGYKVEDNFSTYDTKYSLSKYGLNYSKYNHLWMVFEGSHICWGISYAGANFANSFGVPSHYNRQPGHAAFFVYNKNANNQTTWSIDNNISGWTQTAVHEDVVGYSYDRVFCNWGNINNGWSTYDNATYLVLGSTALDNYDDYVKAELIMSLESLPSISNKEDVYDGAIDVMSYHLDAWEKKVRYYISNNKSDEELTKLAKDIADNMYRFPLPMHDLLNLIKKELKSRNTESSLTQHGKLTNIETVALNKGINISSDPNKNLLAQPDICSTEAKFLLNGYVSELASFSFDGTNKNSIVFGNEYSNVRFKYSLDNGVTWSDTKLTSTSLKYELNSDEINSLNSTNDILIWLEGWSSDLPENAPDKELAYKIDIVDGVKPTNIECNDNEDRLLGSYTGLEYRIGDGQWTDLNTSVKFVGDYAVEVRRKAYSTVLTGPSVVYNFTDNNVENRSYIDISRIELVDCSSEETSTGDNAIHAFDGLLSTRWHTIWKGGDSDRYITVKLDEPVYLTGLDYTPASGNGTCYSADILVSLNGVDFDVAYKATGWSGNTSTKKATFNPIYCQYVRFKGISTIGGFANARLIELFEDNTLSKDIASIEVVSLPTRMTYYENNIVDYSGLNICAKLSDGNLVVIPKSSINVSNIDTSSVGTKTVNVSALGKQTSFDLYVIETADSTWLVNGVGYDLLSLAMQDPTITSDTVIQLLKDIDLNETIVISSGTSVKINGNAHKITRSSTLINSPLFNVLGSLHLSNIVLDGGAIWSGDIDSRLNRGTVIDEQNGVKSASQIIVCGNNSNLILDENTILRNNYSKEAGSGIRVNGKANVTLDEISILDCHSEYFGSAILLFRDDSYNCGEMTINSANIYGCSGIETNNASIVCVDINSKLTINDIDIQNNVSGTGGIIWIKDGVLNINGGKYKNNYSPVGNSIYVSGTANVNINDFDEIEEIYLASDRKVNFTSSLENKYLLLNSSVKTDGTLLATYSNNVELDKLLLALDYKDNIIVGSTDGIKIDSSFAAEVKHSRLNKVTYYDSFIKAYNVSDDGDSIKLLKNVELSEDLLVNKNIDISVSDDANFTGTYLPKISDGYELTKQNNKFIFKLHEHEFVEPVFVWNDDMDECYASACCKCGECLEEYGQVKTSVIQKLTCYVDQITRYSATFINPEFTNQTVDIVTKKCSGHSLIHNDYTSPSCIVNGILEHDYCSRCGKYFIQDKEVDYNSLIVSASEHHLIHHNKVDSTCLKTGSKEYDECEMCGGIFINNKQVSKKDLIINKKAHNLIHHDETKLQDLQNGMKAYDECLECKKLFVDGIEVSLDDLFIHNPNHTITHINYCEATCLENGILEHDHCEECDKDFIDGEIVNSDSLIIPKTGHTSLDEAIKKQDKNQITYYCSYCGEVLKVEKVHNFNLLFILIPVGVISSFIIFIILKKKKNN